MGWYAVAQYLLLFTIINTNKDGFWKTMLSLLFLGNFLYSCCFCAINRNLWGKYLIVKERKKPIVELVTWDPWKLWRPPALRKLLMFFWRTVTSDLHPLNFSLWPPTSNLQQARRLKSGRIQCEASILVLFSEKRDSGQKDSSISLCLRASLEQHGKRENKTKRNVVEGSRSDPLAQQLWRQKPLQRVNCLCASKKITITKKLTESMRLWSNWNSYTSFLGACNHFGRLFGNSNKVKYTPALWPSNSALST